MARRRGATWRTSSAREAWRRRRSTSAIPTATFSKRATTPSSSLRLARDVLAEPHALLGALDELGKALGARLFLLCRRDPVASIALVPRWLRGEERPCLRVAAQLLLVGRAEARFPLLVRVDRRLLVGARGESRAALVGHAPFLFKPLDVTNIDRAPDAL